MGAGPEVTDYPCNTCGCEGQLGLIPILRKPKVKSRPAAMPKAALKLPARPTMHIIVDPDTQELAQAAIRAGLLQLWRPARTAPPPLNPTTGGTAGKTTARPAAAWSAQNAPTDRKPPSGTGLPPPTETNNNHSGPTANKSRATTPGPKPLSRRTCRRTWTRNRNACFPGRLPAWPANTKMSTCGNTAKQTTPADPIGNNCRSKLNRTTSGSLPTSLWCPPSFSKPTWTPCSAN